MGSISAKPPIKKEPGMSKVKFSKQVSLDKESIKITPLMQSYIDKQEVLQDKTLIRRDIDFSQKFDTAVLVFSADWHIGTPDFDLNGVIETLNYVLNTPNATLFMMGDALNTAILGAVSNMFEDLAYPQEQWQIAVSLLHEVAKQGKLTVYHDGNHENRVDKQTGINVTGQAAEALGAPEAHAPYYAIRNLMLKNPECENGLFEMPIITHHGDGIQSLADVKKMQEKEVGSFINGVGHKHVFQFLVRMHKFYNPETGQLTQKPCLDIIFPSAGGGYYGDRKMYRPNYKSPYTAIEVTSVRNPRYNRQKGTEVEELEFVPVYRSMPIMKIADTVEKNDYIKAARKVIRTQEKEFKAEFYDKVTELMGWVEQQGFDMQEQVKKELKQQIKNKYSPAPPTLEKVEVKMAQAKVTETKKPTSSAPAKTSKPKSKSAKSEQSL